MITATMTTTTTTLTRRDMEQKRLLLWDAFTAEQSRYTAMSSNPRQFDEAETNYQYAVKLAADADYDAHEAEYTRLYLNADYTEAN